jgi:hypothetical protein
MPTDTPAPNPTDRPLPPPTRTDNSSPIGWLFLGAGLILAAVLATVSVQRRQGL